MDEGRFVIDRPGIEQQHRQARGEVDKTTWHPLAGGKTRRRDRSQYEQLIEEGKNECFDEKRVSLLKAQVLQLERQVVLLTEGLRFRAAVMLDLNTSLEGLTDKLSSFLSTEETAPEVTIPCPELLRIIETCQAMKLKLQRNQQVSDLSKLALPWTFGGNLAKQPLTLLDICYGKIENINLRYVSTLEGKLSKLWRHLLAMRQNLSFMLAPGQMSSEAAHRILPTAVYARLINHVARCHQSLEECCGDLLTLTLLVPSAPWEVLECSLSQEFTVENVLATLPAFPKGAPQQRARRAVEALVKAQNYSRQMAMQQILALQAELNFHRNFYNLQVKYTDAVFEGIKQAYHTFQDNVAMVLCSPLQDVLSSYAKLKTEASEDALRGFLAAFRNNAEQLKYAVETLSPPGSQQCEGGEALSRCGKEFFLSLERSLKACGEQRDKAAREIETLQVEVDQALETLQNLREQKIKKAEAMRHVSKPEDGRTEGIEANVLNALSPNKSDTNSTPTFLPQRYSSSVVKKESTFPSKQKLECSSGLTIQQKGKLLHRSKSMKASKRPSWHD
ncbi:Hydroxyacylglutathione hydrolase [Varanus komodoensis]|nr:Hydroxyacylglutathione hydrolase [Varanus komodoensis]